MKQRDLRRLPCGRYELRSKYSTYRLNKQIVDGITDIGTAPRVVYHLSAMGLGTYSVTLHERDDEDEDTGIKYPMLVGLCHVGDLSIWSDRMSVEIDKLSFIPRSSYKEWSQKVNALTSNS